MNVKCEKCNQEWELGWTIKQTHYKLFKHKGESGTEKILCQTCYQQDQNQYLKDWERIQEYKEGENMPKEIKGLTKCYAGKIDEIEGKVLSQSKCYHCNPWKVEPEQRERMKKLQENRKDLHWEEKRELEELEKRYGKNNENPKQRENKIKELQARIAELEAITNRTPEQEQELQGKRKELEDLEKETNSSPSDFWGNYKGWIIGGVVILVILIILGIVFGSKKKCTNY